MPVSRITMSRRRFVEELQKSSRVTFSDLRKSLVKTGHMNLATLYRIVDAFSEQGLIHEMSVAGERVIFPCQCENPGEAEGVMISFCENCGAIYDVHTKLTSPYIASMTYARMKSCNACVIR
jgi:Fe2+ or Zn2+ uptake regulation protein